MTLSSDLSRVSYAGDGATSVFAVPFYFLDADDPKVILRDAAGAETIWARGTQYTVSGAGSPTGGTLTVSTSPTDHTPASGETLVILRRVSLTQETDYTEGDPLPAATLERDFDRARMIDQQLAETLGRTLKFADSSTVSGITVPDPAADQVLKWNAAADGLENWATVADISAVAGVVDDIDAVAAIAAQVATVAGDSADIQTVAGDSADIQILADNIGSIAGKANTDGSNIASGADWRSALALGAAATEDVAAGGSGDLLRADGDGSSLTGITAGALVLVSSATASNDAAIVFTGLSATYNSYEIIFNNLKPVTDAVLFLIEFSTDNGSSWQTSNYARVGWSMSEGGTLTGWGGPVETAILFGVVGNETSESISGHFMLYNPAAAQWTRATSTSLWVNSTAGATYTAFYQNVWKDTSAVNAIRLRFSSGNISSGEARLYGRKAA